VAFTAIYPIDNATAVPDAVNVVVLQQNVPSNLLSGVQLQLTPVSSVSPLPPATPGPAPSPIPTPNTALTPGAPVLGFGVSVLAPATTYRMEIRGSYNGGNVCGPLSIAPAGYFTTQ
jgi:hypothetical protein